MSNELADAVFEAIGQVTDPLFARILALESEVKELRARPGVPGPVGPQGADGAKGMDGHDGPAGRDGADAPAPTIEQVKTAILEMPDALTVSLEKYFAAHPVADGKDGAQGPAGADAPRPTVEQVKTALADMTDTFTLIATKHFEAHPPANGKDGRDGQDGAAGRDGKDGVGLAGAVIDREGGLVVTLTDGATKSLGLVVGAKGEPGRDGVDGLGFDDLKAEQIDDQTIELKATKGDQVKVLGRFVMPVHVYEGVYEPGQTYRKGKSVTWDGSLWIAKEETAVTPGTGGAWQLAVKRGREGKPGKGVVGPQGPQGEKGDRGIDRWS